jgi:hypothetical protein
MKLMDVGCDKGLYVLSAIVSSARGFRGSRVASKIGLANNSFIMSVSTLRTEDAYHGVQTLENVAIEATVLAQADGLSALSPLENGKAAVAFRARLEIPGLSLVPEQDFTASRSEDGLILQNNPKNSWPIFLIECVSGSARISVQPSDNTSDGELLNTRVRFALEKAGLFSLCATDSSVKFRFKINHPSDSEKQILLYRAKVCRKLKYIERVLRVSFSLPDEISAEQVQVIERVFRGITEGKFTTRAPDILFEGVSPSSIDLTKPPFTGPGPFSREVGNTQLLFNKRLHVGPVSVYLERAALTDPRVIDHILKGSGQSVDVRFEILDNQIFHTFESYARQSRKRLQRKLERFKEQLAREEPMELVNLLAESFQSDVSADEAIQIAVGWTQYHDLPDRYCPQEPKLDLEAQHWCVPIYLVYSSGEGGPVGEIIINAKTGELVSHTPIEELRSKGLALAEQILHA